MDRDQPDTGGRNRAAIAGRSMSATGRRMILAMAMRAPVLPAETATSAEPFLTARRGLLLARHGVAMPGFAVDFLAAMTVNRFVSADLYRPTGNEPIKNELRDHIRQWP